MWRVIAKDRERGAVAIIYALSFLLLVGFIGLSVDVGAAFAKRQEAQNGADAAAMAVAFECLEAKMLSHCPNDLGAAEEMAAGNERTDGTARIDNPSSDIDYSTEYFVTVTVTADQAGWFLPAAVPGFDGFTVRRHATANFGSPTAGTVTIPIIVSECLFPVTPPEPGEEQVVEIWLPKNAEQAKSAPTGGCEPDYPAGGFGWLLGPNCTAYMNLDGTMDSDTGLAPPEGCKAKPSYFKEAVAQGATAIIPLFDLSSGTGMGGTYEVTRFAVFQLTGFQSQTGNLQNADVGCSGTQPSWASKTCFQGKFMTFVEDPGDFELGGPITETTFARLVG